MREPRRLLALLLAACAAAWAAAALWPAPAQAGVPRSCIHPKNDPLQCPRDTRRVLHKLLPAARVKELQRQYRRRELVAPLEDRERNRLLEEIRRALH